MASACYHPGSEAGIRWDDPLFGVEWPDVGEKIVSEKDRSWPDYQPPLVAANTCLKS
jgi:dTDP-4-dehydrorhamnose 3,5-epimerase